MGFLGASGHSPGRIAPIRSHFRARAGLTLARMCERYVLPGQSDAEREFVPAHCWWKFSPSFNVAFSQYVPAIRLHDGHSEGVMMRWGLIPSWAEHAPTTDDGARFAAIEDLGRSTELRGPWLNSQRCILPAAGFYAWQLTQAKYRQPFFIRLIDRGVFGIGAVWDRWAGDEDDVIESCTIVTVPANPLIAGINNTETRMPAILRRRDYEAWLRGTPVRAKAALQPYPQEWMQAHAVSPRVNLPKHNDATLIQPLS